VGLFVAGDDPQAKATVTTLLAALPAAVTGAGDLTAARFIGPAMMLLVRLAMVSVLGHALVCGWRRMIARKRSANHRRHAMLPLPRPSAAEKAAGVSRVNLRKLLPNLRLNALPH
jgi:hypothetical protein